MFGYPYGYANAYAYGKAGPCVNAANVPVPCADGYAAYGHGVHLLGKRDADAEADPALLYSAYGYPYAAGAYAYGAYPHAVAATPYGLTHSSNVGLCTNYLGAAVPCGRKKRSADAEAEADPALLYSAYGYPYGYNYGYTALNAVAPAVSYAAAPAVAYATTHTVAAAPAVTYAAAPAVTYAAAPALAYAAAPAVVATNAVAGHAVAATPFGYTHSSNVGICTNYLGVQVSC